MRFIKSIIFVVFCLSLAPLLPYSAWSQSTLGYADPSDISNIQDYRLPDWSYRTWDADFSFRGYGSEQRDSGLASIRNRFFGNMGSFFFQNWESEKRNIHLGGGIAGNYTRGHSGDDFREAKTNSLSLDYNINGSVAHYLAGSPFFAQLSGSANRSYAESVSDYRVGDIWDKNKAFQRHNIHTVFAGLGFGHLRNVVPLLRAQRLSERLVTMGRAALSPQQVPEIAQVLAIEYGYRQVFDRSDRHFWVDVLTPMLDDTNPLTAFEIFYLTDILNENIGERFQGFSIETGFTYREETVSRSEYEKRISRNPILHIHWYHNFSLTNQIHFAGQFEYRDQDRTPRDLLNYQENGRYSAEIGHLWNFTDRYNLASTLKYFKYNDIGAEKRRQDVELQSNLQIYLEDRVSLITGLSLSYNHEQVGPQESFDWQWSYSFGLRYDLDRAFF